MEKIYEIGTTGDSRNGSDDGGGEAAKSSIYNTTAQKCNMTIQLNKKQKKSKIKLVQLWMSITNMLALECFSRYRIITSLYSHKSMKKQQHKNENKRWLGK